MDTKNKACIYISWKRGKEKKERSECGGKEEAEKRQDKKRIYKKVILVVITNEEICMRNMSSFRRAFHSHRKTKVKIKKTELYKKFRKVNL